jgi:glycosyltransferase involved in cell wall biosynthesis
VASGVEVSVVIPFRNAAPHFRHQLEALAGQDFDGEWEAVVVDNGSSDGSRAIAEEFLERLNLKIVDAADKPGAGYARNAGARLAAGRKLLFVDATTSRLLRFSTGATDAPERRGARLWACSSRG